MWRTPQRPPLLRDEGDAWSERDRALLARIVQARARQDERAARRAAHQLLVPYVSAVESLVVSRTRSFALRRCDCEEIACATLERLARDLVREPDLRGVSFGAAVARKVKDQIADFLAARSRRTRLLREEPTAPHELPEPIAHHEPPPFEQAAAVEALLQPLAPHEREIVYERHVLDLSIGQVAARRGIQPDAVKKACQRGMRKAREAREARQAGEARKAREAHRAREERKAREANMAREVHEAEATPAREARDAGEASDANSMSTFSASPPGMGDEGPTKDTKTGDSSVGLSNQKSKSETPQDRKSMRGGKRGKS